MKNHIFDSTDPICVFDSIARFVNDAEMLIMSERRAFIALPTFLTEAAETEIRMNFGRTSRHSGITCWPEAIEYLLRTYMTSSAMRIVLEELHNIRRGERKFEDDYWKRLKEEVFRCGNVHREDGKITIYVDGLSDTIRTAVARYGKSVHRREMNFESLAHFAKSEDEAYCAGNDNK